MLNLTKDDKLDLVKSDGSKLTNFCVGANWGAIVKSGTFGFGTTKEKVDLDLSAALFAANNQLMDAVTYQKLRSTDGAMIHSGDDRGGDDENDGIDNEVISVNLNGLDSQITQIVFFLNNFSQQDFARIPYAHIRLYESESWDRPKSVKSIFATFNVSKDPKFAGHVSMVMGKLYKRNGEWKFQTIGEPTRDTSKEQTIRTIAQRFL
jgi:tellurium resistance protein TerZ